MTTDQTLGVIVGITVGINLIFFSGVFLYYGMVVLRSTIKKISKG